MPPAASVGFIKMSPPAAMGGIVQPMDTNGGFVMAEYIEREKILYPYLPDSLWSANNSFRRAYNKGVKAVQDAIAAMPTADVAPAVHGRWQKVDIAGEDPYECSYCGDRVGVWGYRYCPNCGARMVSDC